MEATREKIQLKLSPQAEKYARRDAPLEVRRMAARGALPLPPLELATVLFALMHDPDAEVKGRARDSLEQLPDPVMDAVLSGPAHPSLLDHLAHTNAEREARLERIALNGAAADETIAFLAERPFRRVVEIVSNNQERMMRHPPIVDALGANPLTGRAVIDRILSFLGIEEPPEDEAPASPESLGDEEMRAALAAVFGGELANVPAALLDENAEASPDELAAGGNLYALVQNMTVFQKIKLGRMGNKEARNLLVRDRNKIVAIAAVTSPKITENELLSIAQSRNVSDEVIRTVANNREVTRHYQVKLALATNPKTPQAVAMQFVNYLQERDLRNLMKSKDVPSMISQHARRILSKKGKV
jgi:hypothetical protein